jgi:flavorubredoxin
MSGWMMSDAPGAVSLSLTGVAHGRTVLTADTRPRVDEIADGIFRISAYAAPIDLTVNQFLLLADEPMLVHLGPRGSFASVREAVATIIDPAALRWLTFGHVESDECGSLNQWLAEAPRAQVVFNPFGCLLSLDDLADRRPHRIDDADVLDLGGRLVRVLLTPHAPHNLEAQLIFEDVTATLFCGDLCTTPGRGPVITSDPDWLVATALECEAARPTAPPGPIVPDTLRRLARLRPAVLAVMHGAAFHGDGEAVLNALADAWELRMTSRPAGPSTHHT